MSYSKSSKSFVSCFGVDKDYYVANKIDVASKAVNRYFYAYLQYFTVNDCVYYLRDLVYNDYFSLFYSFNTLPRNEITPNIRNIYIPLNRKTIFNILYYECYNI